MMIKIRDDILSYREMCDAENVQTLQRGMNFRLNPLYSVILMSQRTNAPYKDKIYEDGITIEYEGHDVPKKGYIHKPKEENQSETLPSGKLTQNGLFVKTINEFKAGERDVFRFILKLTNVESLEDDKPGKIEISHNRIIPTEIKLEVYKRDDGKCVKCGSVKNLHFDHDFPYSKGGTSLTAKNIRLLCMRHNLEKSSKTE